MMRAALLMTLTATLAASAAPALATFPGANGEMVYTRLSDRGPGRVQGSLLAFDPRTRAERTVWECGAWPKVPRCDGIGTPAVSPDGGTAAVLSLEVAYGTSNPYRWRLNLIPLDGGAPEVVDVAASGVFVGGDRGRTLRWTGDGSGLSAGVMGIDGATIRPPRLTRRLGLDGALGGRVGPLGAHSLDWSSDGRATYVRRSALFVLRTDGTPRRLVRGGVADPSWSPGGRSVAFARRGQIWIVPSRGGKATQLTRRGGGRPTWSPDGRRIAFVRKQQIHVLDPRSGRVRRVRSTPLDEGSDGPFFTSPLEWRPRARA